MRMHEILIATTNPGKRAEYETVFADAGVEIKTLKDFPECGNVEETGQTFRENAELKAKYYFKCTGLPTIADDGGFEIISLGGEPGVKSHRWIDGETESSDDELIAYCLKRMEGIPTENRGARLRLVMAYYDGETLHRSEAALEGRVVEKPVSCDPGLPFRALLYIPKYDKMYDDLTPEEHSAINHRHRAIKDLLPTILKTLGK